MNKYPLRSLVIFLVLFVACGLGIFVSATRADAPMPPQPQAPVKPEDAQKIENANVQIRANRPVKPTLDPRQANIFKASVITSQMFATVMMGEGVPVKATFNLMNGVIDLNPGAKPAVKVVIDVASWNSNLLQRDDLVRKLFFHSDSPEFGTMTMTVDAVSPEVVATLRKDGKMADVPVTGTLAFNGQSHPVTVMLKMGFNDKNRLAVLSATPATIKCSEWGLSENLQALMNSYEKKPIADEVNVELSLEFEAVK